MDVAVQVLQGLVFPRPAYELGAQVDIRVVIDVIAGSSAGGINGIMLARALAFDLPLAD